MNWVWKIALGLVVLFFAAFAGGAWFAGGFTVTSAAMEPTLHPRDLVLVSRMAYSTGDPGRLDIVVVQLPDLEGQVVRRIAGLPGDQVEVRADDLFVNGQKIDEPYRAGLPEETPAARPAGSAPANFGPVPVPTGMYFVLGDNRKGALDGRQFGWVSRDRVIGRVLTVAGRVISL